MSLINSLFNIALFWDKPFCQLQQLQQLHHGSKNLTFACLYAFIHCTVGQNLQYAHYGFIANAVLAGALI